MAREGSSSGQPQYAKVKKKNGRKHVTPGKHGKAVKGRSQVKSSGHSRGTSSRNDTSHGSSASRGLGSTVTSSSSSYLPGSFQPTFETPGQAAQRMERVRKERERKAREKKKRKELAEKRERDRKKKLELDKRWKAAQKIKPPLPDTGR